MAAAAVSSPNMDVDAPETLGIRQDTEVWFTDGSIVLQAERTLFKVYSGILTQASPIFKSMIAIPQPDADFADMYDGCPLVFMPDAARDVRVFLKAVHDSSFDISALTVTDTQAVLSILRISTKYDVMYLRKRAIDALINWYPSSLNFYTPKSASSRPKQDFLRHVLVANVARETDAPILLPTALLFCCQTASNKIIFDGVTVDGVAYDLAPVNKRAIFIARDKLSHAARTRTQACFFSTHKVPKPANHKCLSPERCNEFIRVYTAVFDDREDPWLNPFFRLNWKAVRSTCCVNCGSFWEAKHKEASLALWQELPTIFGLPSWKDLETSLQESLEPVSEDSPPS